MKIVVLDGYTLNPGDLSWEGFERLGEFTCYDRTEATDTVARIGDAAVVLTNKTAIGRNVIDACPELRYIGVLATGFNVVDTAYATQKGIVVTNIPTYGSAAVAQYVFALLLEVCHNVRRHSDTVFDGKWAASKDFCYWDYPQIELSGLTMGIIGYGKIGRKTATIAQAMGMNVLAYDRPGVVSAGYAELKELYACADVITLHCPLTDENKGMIDKDSIALMKNEVIIINTARGPLVNEKDMAEALNAGRIRAYACDVVETEPIRADNPLLGAKNCIITPHVAWAARNARQRLMDIAVSNLQGFMDGNPLNTVG